MREVVGYCPHCMALRNMRATQEQQLLTDKKDRSLEIVITYHCESCGLFVKDEDTRPASWDTLITSLGKFSADFMVARNQPKIQKR